MSLVGLTSPRNKNFVESMGIYDEVVAYNEIEMLENAEPATFVDMAGSSEIRAQIHRHFGKNLKYSCSVGLSHWDQNGPVAEPLPGPQPAMFFAPDQAAKRIKELGSDGFQKLYGAAWDSFLAAAKDWVNVEHFETAEDLKKNYLAFIEGTAPADAGFIHKL